MQEAYESLWPAATTITPKTDPGSGFTTKTMAGSSKAEVECLPEAADQAERVTGDHLRVTQ